MSSKAQKKVLVVDDDKEIVGFLCNFLQRFGIDVSQARSADEALAKHKEFDPDFIFLDIQMPEGDGIDILKKLKKNNSQAKVIMITGKTDKESQVKAKKYGALDYITKPLDLGDLSEKIQNYIL